MPENYSDLEIFNGVLKQDNSVLNYVYQNYYPAVRNLVVRNNGSEDMALDVFQDGMIGLYTNIKTGKYILSPKAKLMTYFIQMCKYRWYDIQKSKAFNTTSELNPDFDKEDGSSIQDVMESVERQNLIHDLIGRLGEKCQKIITLIYWERKKMEEIAELFQMEAKSVKNGKYRCMQQLKEMMSNNNMIKLM